MKLLIATVAVCIGAAVVMSIERDRSDHRVTKPDITISESSKTTGAARYVISINDGTSPDDPRIVGKLRWSTSCKPGQHAELLGGPSDLNGRWQYVFSCE